MPSLAIKPTYIANFPAAADRSLSLFSSHQQHYLSPPLTPFLQYPTPLDQTNLSQSPPSDPRLPLPSLREMLPHQGRGQTSPTESEAHGYSLSASQQTQERSINDSIERNSISIPRGIQHVNDPTRLLPLYANASSTILQTAPPIVSPLLRRNKAHVASACVNCKKAHLACDANRPCRRCVSLEKQASCVDVQHKRRGRPRLKDSAPSAGNLQSERRPSYLHRHVSDDAWKYHTSSSARAAPYFRDPFRREYHHHRSFSQGSQPESSRTHPYAHHPTPPTSGGYNVTAQGLRRDPQGYFDLASPSSQPSYPQHQGPRSPNYYPPPPQSHYAGPPPRDSFPPPHSPYQTSSAIAKESPMSAPPERSQHLLPVPETSHPGLSRRGSFPSSLRQSEISHNQSVLHRSGSSPAPEHSRVMRGENEATESVKLPSLKDLGVPFH